MEEKKVEITTLVENTVHKPEGLLAEHGLSFFVKFGDKKLLFDTGAGNAILNNADKMKIDLSSLDAVVLSHGHNDHTGGLSQVLAGLNEVNVYAHSDIFDKKIVVKKERVREAFIPNSRRYYEEAGANFIIGKDSCELFEGIMLTGEVPRKNDFEKADDVFFKEDAGGRKTDKLMDDQSMIIGSSKGIVVVLGCAHSGVINILEHVSSLTGKKDIYAVMGGMHLKDASHERIEATCKELEKYNIQVLAPCHCTGFRASAVFYRNFERNFTINNVGSKVII